jgi:hypothetical protein
MTNEELEQKVKRLEEQLTEVRIELLERKAPFIPYKPYEVELPEYIDDYVYINNVGNIYNLNTLTTVEFEKIYKRGLAFETKKEAEKYDKERILLFKLHKWAEEHNGDWYPDWEKDDDKFSIYYYHSSESFSVFSDWNCNSFSKLPCFKSEELAREFIEEFGKDIKEVLC